MSDFVHEGETWVDIEACWSPVKNNCENSSALSVSTLIMLLAVHDLLNSWYA